MRLFKQTKMMAWTRVLVVKVERSRWIGKYVEGRISGVDWM